MSELADRERRIRRSWAIPGGAHDRFIRLLKIGLPTAVGIVLAFLAFAPLEEKQDVSFVLDKTKVDQTEERMQIQDARYRGQDKEGRPFLLTARTALQQSAADPIVDITGMRAQILLDSGPARLAAPAARYDMEREEVAVPGPILFRAADGYRIATRDVTVDLRERRMTSQGPVDGLMPLGRFSAGRLEVDLPERRVVLSGRARIHIVQGAVR